MIDYLAELKKEANHFKVYSFVSKVLDDPRFATWSGAGKDIHHHYGDGGLLQHTYEDDNYCSDIADTHGHLKEDRKQINQAELFISAVWHDYGKIWDYQKLDGVWAKYDTHARQIHHISRSALEWNKYASALPWMDDGGAMLGISIDNITHNILSHHGMREWGSPVAPNTKEAWILHLADNISARLDDCTKHDGIK